MVFLKVSNTLVVILSVGCGIDKNGDYISILSLELDFGF